MSIGRSTPVDSLAPNAIAIRGTLTSPNPLIPVFVIPVIRAESNKMGIRSNSMPENIEGKDRKPKPTLIQV
jgi:hypothetical protein